MKLLTPLVILALVAAMFPVAAVAQERAGDDRRPAPAPAAVAPAAADPNLGLYIVALKDPRIVRRVGPPPDIDKLGGSVVADFVTWRVVRLPHAALEQLQKHESVNYIQRVSTGAPGTNTALPATATAVSGDGVAADWAPPTWFSGEYRYDGAGNIKNIGAETAIYADGKATLNSDGSSNAYVYDTAGRLVSATVNHGTSNVETYRYDSFGNRVERKRNSESALPLEINQATNRLKHDEYDRAGNLTGNSAGGRAYVYDSFNQIRGRGESVHYASTFYVYTADDERIGIVDANSYGRWMVRDFEGNVVREFEGALPHNGLPEDASWMWLEDYVYGEGGQQVAARREAELGGTRHFHLDHLGTPRMITNDAGAAFALHDYYPFGLEESNYRQEMERFGHDRPEPKKFTGHEREFLSGTYEAQTSVLDYMHARYYSPHSGRFLSVDPTWESADLGKPQSWNRYAYVMNNPVNMTDPDGKIPIWVEYVMEAFSGDGPMFEAGMSRDADKPPRPQADQGGRKGRAVRTSGAVDGEIVIDGNKYPEAARHIDDAQAAGQPSVITVDRKGASERRRAATSGTPTVPGADRDEYPPAVAKEGGKGSSVRHIRPGDNRGAGGSMGRQLEKFRDNAKVVIKTFWNLVF